MKDGSSKGERERGSSSKERRNLTRKERQMKQGSEAFKEWRRGR